MKVALVSLSLLVLFVAGMQLGLILERRHESFAKRGMHDKYMDNHRP